MNKMVKHNSAEAYSKASTREGRFPSESSLTGDPGTSRALSLAHLMTAVYSSDNQVFVSLGRWRENLTLETQKLSSEPKPTVFLFSKNIICVEINFTKGYFPPRCIVRKKILKAKRCVSKTYTWPFFRAISRFWIWNWIFSNNIIASSPSSATEIVRFLKRYNNREFREKTEGFFSKRHWFFSGLLKVADWL